MSHLLKGHAEAIAWIDGEKATLSRRMAYGKLADAVIWSDAKRSDGKLIVPIDPDALVSDINTNGYPLLKGHDPGFPVGKVLSAKEFIGEGGTRFVAAVIGYYKGAQLSLRELGLDSIPAVLPPTQLPAPPDDCWIVVASDPREVDLKWVDELIRAAPITVKSRKLSHNAADSIHELVRIGLYYTFLIWNPFVKAVATEAGKDAYAGVRHWLRYLIEKIAELRDPIVEIQSHHNDCYVSFMLRGKNISGHYAAVNALSGAAAQAQYLISNMKSRHLPPKLLVYEFRSEDAIWFPSYVELEDGRLVTDNKLLIALEQLPSGISLGLSSGREIPGV